METFCTNSLNVKNYTITFKPDFNKRQKRYYETEIISFLNVPSEAEEEAMTQFAQQCAVVLPRPRYPTENINDIDYLIGTRIYKVHSSKDTFQDRSNSLADKYNAFTQINPNNRRGLKNKNKNKNNKIETY